MLYEYDAIGHEAVFLNHYDLSARVAKYTPAQWREFLMDSRVLEFLSEEQTLMQQTNLRKLLKGLDGNTRSTGQAQLINTLLGTTTTTKKKDGPIFIYSYVPLNEEEQHAPNTSTLKINPFKTNSDE